MANASRAHHHGIGAPTCSRLNALAHQKTPVFAGVQRRLRDGAPSQWELRALGGDFGNLDAAANVSMVGAVPLGRREGGRQEGRPQGGRSAYWGCRGRDEEGTQGGGKMLETSKEHPRNMLATCLQL